MVGNSRELNRYKNYAVDTAIPVHRVKYNRIVDLPVGKQELRMAILSIDPSSR